MSDTNHTKCEPSEEWQNIQFHWLMHPCETTPVLWEWQNILRKWKLPYRHESESNTPEIMTRQRYTYFAPCRPCDAEMRVKLEKENAIMKDNIKCLYDCLTMTEQE